MRNFPNYLTIMRMVAVPILVIVMFFIWPDYPDLRDEKIYGWWAGFHKWVNPEGQYNEQLSFLAAMIFIIASITDLFDGYLARKWDVVSSLGKLLDPLADKLMVMCVMVMLVPLGRLPAWMVVIVLTREISITALRAIAASEGKNVIEASALGKYKMIFQIVGISGLLIHYKGPVFKADFHTLGAIFFLVSLVFTIWSGWDYVVKYARYIPEQPGN
jgi:CDP-diacylglycerol--glycerol-3-phosphate 3-phosphatidyltransferase